MQKANESNTGPNIPVAMLVEFPSAWAEQRFWHGNCSKAT